MKKQMLSMMLILSLLITSAMAEVTQITGSITSSQDDTCIVNYAFPQFDDGYATDETLNLFYEQLASELPQAYLISNEEQSSNGNGAPNITDIHYEITRNDERYVSVLLTVEQLQSSTVVVSANTFARDGYYVGEEISLSQVLGLEETDDPFSATKSQAELLAYTAIWEIITLDQQNFQSDYLDNLTIDQLYNALNPESDFYLDQDGNIVFYIQSGLIASNMAGILTFPFMPAELLSVVQTIQSVS